MNLRLCLGMMIFCSESFGGFLKPLFKLPENISGTAEQVSLSQYMMKKNVKKIVIVMMGTVLDFEMIRF